MSTVIPSVVVSRDCLSGMSHHLVTPEYRSGQTPVGMARCRAQLGLRRGFFKAVSLLSDRPLTSLDEAPRVWPGTTDTRQHRYERLILVSFWSQLGRASSEWEDGSWEEGEIATSSVRWNGLTQVFRSEGVFSLGARFARQIAGQARLSYNRLTPFVLQLFSVSKENDKITFLAKASSLAWVPPSDERACQLVPSLAGKQTGRLGGNKDGRPDDEAT